MAETKACDDIEYLRHFPKSMRRQRTALLNSDFDRDCACSVRRIGIWHRDIALNPLWYVAGYAKLKLSMMERMAALDMLPEKKSCLITTPEKYVAMDMSLALATYQSAILHRPRRWTRSF